VRRVVGGGRAAAPTRAPEAPGRAPPPVGPGRVERDPLRAADRHRLGAAAARVGLGLGHDLLAPASRLA
ncbi:MAG: hypothetical protein AVDCRST_MAG40-1480, partial [uncultured Gemmatimonadaceae bacterium]